ncbi:LamG-like jellyroll fold domain-containing protein [Flavivirga aquimarina]|uniref:LamG-like jellyroll fold domain-containing protein n=1 Tax=Flavivirga aquimarina TaxID=2027862 RepID=A0ABT8WEY5_9FLAO|nr:LamG-like jellyroll fold domain-containing protein [Flavivirga aquimarina]MDO5971719.1 LamG-like jellyroll fold domain-containing protein [Flavivirga aquimarina]
MNTNTLWTLLLFTIVVTKMYTQSPNVIVIIADDMGWSQVSTGLTNLNNPSDFFETPNLETLASGGISFPYGYVNGSNCAPTRAALLSGQYASRATNNIFAVDNLNRGGNSTLLVGPDNGLPSGVDELPKEAITLAETMKTAGYATVHLGKYHVGENEATDVSDNAATDQGFDVNYGGGTKGNPGDYFASNSGVPYTFGSNIGPELDAYAEPYTTAESNMLAGDTSLTGTAKHVTDALADAAMDFIDTNINSPFFMHFSNFAIHGPFNPSDARPDLRAKYEAKAISDPSSMGHDRKPGQAALAEGMDQTIGRLINYLKTTADPRNPGNMLSENTLVYFISDNGGAVHSDDAGPLRGMKGEWYEGGIRSVSIVWSEAPWLVNKGTVNTTPIVGFDIYPTCVEVAGGTLPGGGYDIDGVSHWQMLTNGTALSRDALYWHYPGYLIDSNRDARPVSIIRKGDYKLIYNYETTSYELYDLINDISEATNLLAGSPDLAILTIGNDMSTDLQNHLINISAPLPTYRSNGETVDLPYIISTSGAGPNSTDGCQAVSGYEAYWDFDSASDANDASGNGHDPNPVNGTLTYDSVDFKEGDQSVVFDGTVDINYSSATFMSQTTSARTVSAWIKPTSLTGVQEIFDEGGNTIGIAMRLNGSNLESIIRETVSVSDVLSASFPSDGDWHHVALVYDGGNTSHKLYIDGVEVATSSSAPASIGSHNTTGGGIGGVIGSWDSFVVSADSYFTGKMDAFSVYNAALSASQIEEASCLVVANSTAGCQPTAGYEAFWDFDFASDADDASGNDHNPTLAPTGAITYDDVDFKEGDRSVIFDGTEAIQYATNSTSPDSFLNLITNSRSIMVWIKPSSLTGIQNIFDEGGQNRGIAIRLNNANLEAIVRETSSVADQISASFPNDGDWHHIAFIYNQTSTTQKLYIDGAEVATSSSTPASLISHYSYGGIGGKLSGNDSFQNASDTYFTGKMDAFAVYDDYVLTPTEIQNAYPIWYLDADGDNYAVSTQVQCTSPGIGYTTTVLPVTDCDDSDPGINPGATEITGNTVDEDCDGEAQNPLSNEKYGLENIIIAPNPFNNNITIKLPLGLNHKDYNISLYDLRGRLIIDKKYPSAHETIHVLELDKLESATYIFKIINKETGDSITRRLIKH